MRDEERFSAMADGTPNPDVTDRTGVDQPLRLSEERARAEEALRESEERYRGLAEQITDGIFVTDSDGRYADANRAGCEMFGYTLEELRTLTVRDVILADELQRLPEQFERLKGGEIVRNDWRFRRKDGSIFIGELVSRLLSNGRLQGVVRDVTERKRAEDAVREADRRKDDFLATLAHELRNPLAQLSAGTAVIRMASGDPETVLEHCTIMERQVQQLARLVDDVLDLSDLTHRGLRLDKKRIELAAITRTAVEQSRILIEQAGHTLSVTLPQEHVFLEADPLRLAQVLTNLLSNAVKYTPRGGHIELAAERDGSGVRVSVRDNGLGIPSNMLGTIFEMFSQLDRSLETGYKGLGIGLSLVKSLVHMHGGVIEAHSEGLGKGSVFSVWLPITFETELSQPAPLPHEAARSVHDTVNRRVLLVEDNRDVARSMVRLIRLLGHDIRVAFDGREAIADRRRVQAGRGADGHRITQTERLRGCPEDSLNALGREDNPRGRDRMGTRNRHAPVA